MRRIALSCAAGLAAALLGACDAPSAPEASDPGDVACPAGARCVTGTIRHFSLEGGFWAVRGDDGVTYDPSAALPDDFRREGLRVHLTARLRPALGSFRMVGPVVDVIALRRL